MYVAIRRYTGAEGTPDEIGRGAQRGLPGLRELPGFLGWYLLDAGDGTWTSVSIFDTRAGAEESTRVEVAHIREHLAGCLPTSPEVTVWAVAAYGTR